MAGKRYKRKLYYLVKYILDDIYQVTSRSNIKKSKGNLLAKYYDGIFYEAIIIAKHPSRQALTDIATNLSKNLPIVMLERNAELNQVQGIHLVTSQIFGQEVRNEALSRQGLTEMVTRDNVELERTTDIQDTLVTSHKFQEEMREEALSREALTEIATNSSENLPIVELEIDQIQGIQITSQNFGQEVRNEDFSLDEAVKHNIIILENILLNVTEVQPNRPTPEEFRTENQLIQTGERKNKKTQKKHCCYYCYKQVYKIYRHYIMVHKQEKEVIELTGLPPKSARRKLLLDILRKKGDFNFNTQIKTENEKMIVCCNTLTEQKTKRERDVPCPNCTGYYSKFSIRHHIARCMPDTKKNKRRVNIQAECRRLANNIHQNASDDLKYKVFPFLNEDEVTNAIRYDEAIIHYGNYLCRKYTTPHHYAQIRSNMRALGRLILAIKQINPNINNQYDALDVCHIQLIVKGIDEVAGLDENSNLYRAPATAMLLSTELKKVCKLLQMEFLKTENKEGQKRMDNMLIIFNLEFHVSINKKSIDTQKVNNRKRKIILPKTDQIATFRNYLEDNIRYYISRLNKKYEKNDWIRLSEYTLAHLAVFNRKRPGETQRILIEDYENYEVMDNEITEDFDTISKEQVKKWARIKFTGKLGKNTALLVHRDLGFTAIDLILKYREVSGVPTLNRYIFGCPSQFHTQNTFQACKLIRNFAEKSGIENPHLLRTRLLRQHFATETATATVDNHLEGRVSDFMSHQRKIHEDYYVITQKRDDITKVSKLLENFSSCKQQCSKPLSEPMASISQNTSKEDGSILSDTSFSDSDEALSQSEINYVMGKKKSRTSWNSDEKNTAREYFHEEIYCDLPLERAKVKKFYERNRNLYKFRTPHLIIQWIKCERNKVINNKQAKRMRWSTPEKEIVKSTTERHSSENTTPTIPECELIFNKNQKVLENRSAQSIKAYICSQLKKENENNLM